MHLAETPEIIEYLILQNFEVNCQDNNGWTVLHYSVYRGLHDCVRVLLQIGADVKITDNCGVNSLDLAKEHSPNIALLLEPEFARLEKSESELKKISESLEPIKKISGENQVSHEKNSKILSNSSEKAVQSIMIENKSKS